MGSNESPSFGQERKFPVIVIAGPTAAGKSAIAIELAALLSGEIVSVDSMQVYRGMDIGTAKPSKLERERVPHHLIDILELSEKFDAARFVSMADAAIGAIRSHGKLPILCGGTGFYIKAWLEGLGEAPATDPALRDELSRTPLETLLAELQEKDSETFKRIDRQNPRRVVRAVEVIRLTGRPYSAQQADWSALSSKPLGQHFNIYPKKNAFCFGISWPPGELRKRIDRRVDQMFRDGLVAETASLAKRGLVNNPTAMQALGYRQVAEHLNGVRPLDQTIELVKIRTRQFAKRQMTWFKRQLRLEWLPLNEKIDAVTELARRISALT